MEVKDLHCQLADSAEDEAYRNGISRRIKRLPLAVFPTTSSGVTGATTASTDAAEDAHLPQKTWPSDVTVETTPPQTPDEIVKGDLPEESKMLLLNTLMATDHRKLGRSTTSADSVVEMAQRVDASETIQTPLREDDDDQSSWLSLDSDGLSQNSSGHPDHEFRRDGSHESYGTYISGMRSLAEHEAEQSNMKGGSEQTASWNSNQVVQRDRPASKSYDRDGCSENVCGSAQRRASVSSLRRETELPIDDRPIPGTARRNSMPTLLRKKRMHGTGGVTGPNDISRRSSTGASAKVGGGGSSSNRRRDAPAFVRRSSDYGGVRLLTSDSDPIRRRASLTSPDQRGSRAGRKEPSNSRRERRKSTADVPSGSRTGPPAYCRRSTYGHERDTASRSSLERRASTSTTRGGKTEPDKGAGQPPRRPSVGRMGSILGGLFQKMSSLAKSTESHHSLSPEELARLDRSLTGMHAGRHKTSTDSKSGGKTYGECYTRRLSLVSHASSRASNREMLEFDDDMSSCCSGSEFSVESK